MNVVISGENRWDNYGNFFFKDKAGNEHKIGEKRKNQVELVAIVENNPGQAVSLTYAEYKGEKGTIEYIVGVKLVSEQLETSQEESKTDRTTPAPQELGMWWKELGECLRSGEIDKTTPHGKLLRAAYYAQMFQVLNLKIKKEES